MVCASRPRARACDCVSGCDNGIAEPQGSFARRQPPIRRYLTRHSYSYNRETSVFLCPHDLAEFGIFFRQRSAHSLPFKGIIA